MDDMIQPAEAVRLPMPCLSPEDHTEAETPADFVPMRLLLQPGGLCVELSRPDMLVGRHSTADVRLCLPDISRRHCRFVFSDGHWEVLDLNSLNGVFVNGQRLNEANLCHGDTVRIASLTFLVDIQAEARPGQDEDSQVGVLRSIGELLPRRKAS